MTLYELQEIVYSHLMETKSDYWEKFETRVRIIVRNEIKHLPTREEFKHLPTKEEFYKKMDEVVTELQKLRDEVMVVQQITQ